MRMGFSLEPLMCVMAAYCSACTQSIHVSVWRVLRTSRDNQNLPENRVFFFK